MFSTITIIIIGLTLLGFGLGWQVGWGVGLLLLGYILIKLGD